MGYLEQISVDGTNLSVIALLVASPSQTSTPNPSIGKYEVLGDRVRCDVRYQELKLPESEYRAFFDRCMGNTGGINKAN